MEMTNYRVFGSCEIEIASPCTLIIFGGHGDLAKRKLVPSLYRLFKNNLLSERCLILSADRVENTDECYRERMRGQVKAALPQDFDNASWDRFARVLYYSAFDFGLPESYEALLKQRLTILDEKHGTKGNHIFYLAVPPSVFPIVVGNLEVTGLSALKETGYPYIVVEKPFGRDLDSARALNLSLSECFEERQIFRIDHYIAKETVQNMLIFRFANSIFEPLWTRSFIDHVQITASETLGVEGRAGYYEQSGVLRDMFQSHMFQLLAVTAMEPPVKFDAERVRDEKIKVFRSMRPFDLDHLDETVVTGQYGEGAVRGEILPAYREEPGVSPHSTTPTFAALKVFIDNWRWNGVPFYLRSGKRLSTRKTEISIHFKKVPHLMLSSVMDNPIDPNVLVFRLQPNEGIHLAFQTKKPGSRVCVNPEPVVMDYSYEKGVLLDAYEWVLLDCIRGDQMLFLRQEGVEETWRILTPLLEKLESTTGPARLPNYPQGSSGPEESELLMARDGRSWRRL
jgi:glucose-6-phosphate 1-dehydrogenase